LLECQALSQAEAWARRALTAAAPSANDADKNQTLVAQLLLANIDRQMTQKEKPDSPRRKELLTRAIELYEAVHRANPSNLVAGNNLAYLLVQERKDAEGARAVVEDLRKGRYSGKPISGDRLHPSFLDTLGTVYRAAGQNELAVQLFKEAAQRYDR